LAQAVGCTCQLQTFLLGGTFPANSTESISHVVEERSNESSLAACLPEALCRRGREQECDSHLAKRESRGIYVKPVTWHNVNRSVQGGKVHASGIDHFRALQKYPLGHRGQPRCETRFNRNADSRHCNIDPNSL
jgi:hypothetical protein